MSDVTEYLQNRGNTVINEAMRLAKNIGLQAIATAMPHEFEWYMVALELATADNKTIDYLTFPIMPNSLSKVEQNRTSIKKSLSGVTVLQNSALPLGEIVLQGNFGRGFKNLVGVNNDVSIGALAYSMKAGKYDLYSLQEGSGRKIPKVKTFNAAVKTGYGVVKMLQAMLSKSVGHDNQGRPFRLFFYNMAFGESYQVVVPSNGMRFYQDLSNNMIWNYDLRLTIVAPLDAVVKDSRQWKQLAASAIKGSVDIVSTEVKNVVGYFGEKGSMKIDDWTNIGN